MKTTLFTALILLFSIPKIGYNQSFGWVKSIAHNHGLGNSIAADDSGNVYTTGMFSNTSDFDPNSGTYNLTASGNFDVYIQKLSPEGELIWAKRIGNTTYNNGWSIALDDQNNVLVTGFFYGTVDFDPGAGTYYLTSTNSTSFILKLNSNGSFIWAKMINGPTSTFVEAKSIATDHHGSVYLTGSFTDSIDFDPGSGTSYLVSNGDDDIFILKLDSGGNYEWAHSFGSTYDDHGTSVTVSSSGRILVVGYYRYTVDFDPSSTTYNLTPVGFLDPFILKLDPDGSFVWAKTFGGIAGNYAFSVATDADDNVYTTGDYGWSVDFDPGSGVHSITSSGHWDSYVQKLDSNGNFIWAKSFGGQSWDKPHSIAIDDNSNIYVTGNHSDSCDFDPGSGVYMLPTTGTGWSAFTLKLDQNGDFVWANSMGDDGDDRGHGITTHGSNVYSIGVFAGTIDFDPDTASTFMLDSDTGSIYILKYEQCTPSTSEDIVYTCDSLEWIDGNVYYESNNSATYILSSASGCDSIISLNLTITNVSSVESIAACDSLEWIDGNTYYSNNTSATHVLTSSSGCDSTVSLNLSITHSTNSTDQISSCSAYTWMDGNTYTSNNTTATHILTNSNGCDSVVTLNLTIIPPTYGGEIIHTCYGTGVMIGGQLRYNAGIYYDSLTSAAGCDSVSTVFLVVHNDKKYVNKKICDGDTYFAQGAWQSQSGVYLDTFQSIYGCDSVIETTLTVTSIDTSVSITANTLHSLESNASGYQWIDCVSSAAISGETNSNYTPSASGYYQVEIMKSGCKDSSACVYLEIIDANPDTSLSINSSKFNTHIYPNPTSGIVNIDFGMNQTFSVVLYNASGQLLMSRDDISSQLFQLNINQVPGTYHLEVKTLGNVQHYRIIKI